MHEFLNTLQIAFIIALCSSCVPVFAHNRQEYPNPDPIVHTRYGPVQGFIHRIGQHTDGRPMDAAIFLGIPYAAAPIGERRFEKPEPPSAYVTPERRVLKAIDFPPGCASLTSNTTVTENSTTPTPTTTAAEEDTSEDCLYLNVFTPAEVSPDAAGFPVLVWIHGGGWSTGSTKLYGYKPFAANFVSRGVVVVTIQYRLGAYGFFATNDRRLGGNLGLWDQRAALVWVRSNINAFGGNAERVTVWGQNAGAASASALSLSRWTRDLFHQSIEMSGSVLAGWANSQAVLRTSRTLATTLGCPFVEASTTRRMLDCLKNASTESINQASGNIGWRRDDINFAQWHPRFDGDFFDARIEQLLAESPPKATLIGLNSRESAIFTLIPSSSQQPSPADANQSVLAPESPGRLAISENATESFGWHQLVGFIDDIVAPERLLGAQTNATRAELVRFYADRGAPLPPPSPRGGGGGGSGGKGGGKLENDETIETGNNNNNTAENEMVGDTNTIFFLDRYTQLLTDLQFVVPALTGAIAKSAKGWPVYLFQLSYMNPAIPLPIRGAEHSYEFAYLFGFSIVGAFNFTDDDLALQRHLVTALANFVWTGNPSTEWTIWPATNAREPLIYLDLDPPEPVARRHLAEDRLVFWGNLTAHTPFDLVRDCDKRSGKAKIEFE